MCNFFFIRERAMKVLNEEMKIIHTRKERSSEEVIVTEELWYKTLRQC